MGKNSRQAVQQSIIDQGIVPVFNHDNLATALRVVKACYKGGMRVFEWTNRGHRAVELFPKLIKTIRQDCPDLHLGVGSIVDDKTAVRYIGFGADFLVSPILDPDLSAIAREHKMLWIPGCGTATEIHQAQKWGAGLVKVFPGDVLGPGFVKSVLAPMPWSMIMPTAGVTTDRDNLSSWFAAGVKCVGIGSKLLTPQLIKEGAELKLQKQIEALLGLVREIRED